MNLLQTSIAVFAIVAPTAQAAIITAVTGVYDETGRGNTVDASFSAAPTAVTGSGPAPTLLDVATFKTTIAAAFAAGRGGVMTFDDVTGPQTAQTSMQATYGVGQTLTISNTGSSGAGTWSMDMGSTAAITSTPISGSNYLRLGNPLIIFNFLTPLEAFAFTALGRNDARVINLTITYDNNTTATYGQYTIGPSGGSTTGFSFSDTSANDTFFGFQAPTGLLIKSISFTAATGGANGNNLVLDDIAFIVPEPSAALLSLIGCLGFLSRRRR